MGEMLTAAGIPIVADPRPEMSFFTRSDNVVFAWAGVPGHTLSSYNMHREYHTPDDEVDRVDFDHMARAIENVVRAARVLADGPKPEWKPNGRPEPPRRQ
jgi:Iap family predicted aminopeptidase